MDLRNWILTWTLSLSIAAPALATSDSDEATEEARRHVKEAKVAYTLGEFDKAIAAWKEAYRLKPLPVILFNLAQAYRMSGDYKESVFQYENYLRGLPNAPNRLEVEQRIEQLAPLIAVEQEAQQSPMPETADVSAPTEATRPPVSLAPVEKSEPPPMTTTNEPVVLLEDAFVDLSARDGTSLEWAPWVISAVAAACAVGSAVTYALARGHWSEATSVERKREEVDALIGAGDTKHSVALGLGGAAAAVGVGAAVLFVF